MEFFDSHCHFDFAIFDHDRDLVWSECNALGLNSMLVPGVAPSQWEKAAQVADKNLHIYLGVGLHPWWIEKEFAQNFNMLKQQLADNLSLKKCVAIGECGLDAGIETPLEVQHQVLDVHLQLAHETKMPVIIHCVKAHNELLQQLKKYQLPAGGVIHAFSGSYEMATQYWSMGFRLGIGGTITYERANKTRNAVKQLPLDAILLETDAPDMPLNGKQGQRNSPVNIIAIAQTLADLRAESIEHVATHTTTNTRQLFKIIH
ncbi:deoxyribonuclease [Cellvibrio zantedeschiae]|uniref:Deoxyribonuclease n=1 Tax=Cellvibrio zantedeschiae TaxID=1237077 RepID=A0ABQ3B3T5_9GAMM|nr:TatD family hydrolase [Cellvibrio zantedeschiae]GGY75324.1 deoxyribonuclease [Cellvibrio zantedeschiae]